ncbi:MAG: hypothetical protein ABI790_19150, partial [Betaproteobacteria bacterium]
PREENGKAPASGPLSSAQARRIAKYKLDFTNMTVAQSENGNETGPTHEICRLEFTVEILHRIPVHPACRSGHSLDEAYRGEPSPCNTPFAEFRWRPLLN